MIVLFIIRPKQKLVFDVGEFWTSRSLIQQQDILLVELIN